MTVPAEDRTTLEARYAMLQERYVALEERHALLQEEHQQLFEAALDASLAPAKRDAERLVSAIESIGEAFVLFDPDGRVVLCNAPYRRLAAIVLSRPVLGCSYEEVLDVGMSNIAFADDAERARFREQRLAEWESPSSVFDIRTLDGRYLRVLERRTPEGGRIRTVWDLTADIRQKEELREARTAADRANAAKTEFLSSVSHELRTPLNAILGFAQMLERDRVEPLGARHRDRVQQISRGGSHLLHLIDDILDLSRIEAGRLSVSPEPVDVAHAVGEVRATLEDAAARADVRIELSPVPAGLPRVLADPTRFSQILMNFGSNAIKYNRAGGRATLGVSAPRPDRVRVTVSDTGPGIPLEKQEKLFQPFQRAGQENGPIEGTGIGLAISQRLAELMGGTTGFRSLPGEGSEFWVDLPVAGPPAADIAGHASAEPASAVARSPSGAVLYIEDNASSVALMKDVLEVYEGVELIAAPSGETGVSLARSCSPKVILMDLHLPGMSGVDALRVLRGDPRTRDIPVVALTAAATKQDRIRGEEAGFYRYLTKPLNIAELERVIEPLLAGA